jgi:hypothetical protein
MRGADDPVFGDSWLLMGWNFTCGLFPASKNVNACISIRCENGATWKKGRKGQKRAEKGGWGYKEWL